MKNYIESNDVGDANDVFHDEEYLHREKDHAQTPMRDDEYQFLEHCFRIQRTFQDWARRNALLLFEKLTYDAIADYISFNFSFPQIKYSFEDAGFLVWREHYDYWLRDLEIYEVCETAFENCPSDKLDMFVYLMSSGRFSKYLK